MKRSSLTVLLLPLFIQCFFNSALRSDDIVEHRGGSNFAKPLSIVCRPELVVMGLVLNFFVCFALSLFITSRVISLINYLLILEASYNVAR